MHKRKNAVSGRGIFDENKMRMEKKKTCFDGRCLQDNAFGEPRNNPCPKQTPKKKEAVTSGSGGVETPLVCAPIENHVEKKKKKNETKRERKSSSSLIPFF